jgi:AhpD family alkylhydroperoxidase
MRTISFELKGDAMQQQMVLKETSPGAYRAMAGLERYLATTGLDEKLLELVKIRAQINGCAFCIDLHTKEARNRHESEQRIYALDAWREAPFFTPEERAALAFTEAITLVAETRVPDKVYEEARRLFGEERLAELIMAIVTINAWNRIAISTRMGPKETAA